MNAPNGKPWIKEREVLQPATRMVMSRSVLFLACAALAAAAGCGKTGKRKRASPETAARPPGKRQDDTKGGKSVRAAGRQTACLDR